MFRRFRRFRRFRGFRGSGVLLVAVLLAGSACAAHVFVPPPGPGVPAPDAAAAWDEAARACRDVRNVSANVRVAVRAGRGKSPSLAVTVVATAAGGIRLDGAQVFLLAGNASRADYLRRDDNRFVTARADEIVEAMAGVKLGPERLLAVLTGCVATSPGFVDGARFGSQLAVRTRDSRVFLARRDGRWRAVAGDADGIVVDYRGFDGDWPSAWRAAAATSAAILDVTVTDLTVNDASLDGNTAAFQVKLPPSATPMTLEELRAAGPLRGGK